MNIPYEIGQNIWQVSICDYRDEKRVDFCKYEISSITIKRSKEIKLRLTSCDKGRGWVHEIPETYINRKEPIYAHNGMKYFTGDFEANKYYEKLVEQATRRNLEIEKRKETN